MNGRENDRKGKRKNKKKKRKKERKWKERGGIERKRKRMEGKQNNEME